MFHTLFLPVECSYFNNKNKHFFRVVTARKSQLQSDLCEVSEVSEVRFFATHHSGDRSCNLGVISLLPRTFISFHLSNVCFRNQNIV